MLVKSHYIVECQSPGWTGDWFPRQGFISFVFTRKLLKHFIGSVNFFPERRLQFTSYGKIPSHTRFGATSVLQKSVFKVTAMGNSHDNVKNLKQYNRVVQECEF